MRSEKDGIGLLAKLEFYNYTTANLVTLLDKLTRKKKKSLIPQHYNLTLFISS